MHKAIDLGVNFFDTADMYGWGANERLLGKAFKCRWDEVIAATKFAVMRGPNGEFLGLNGKPEYIRQACDQSLQNLGVESIDLYYMHRQDTKVEIGEIVGAMSELVKQGKVKHLGLSEVNAATLRRATQFTPFQRYKPNIRYGVVNQKMRFLMFVKSSGSPLWPTVRWDDGS